MEHTVLCYSEWAWFKDTTEVWLCIAEELFVVFLHLLELLLPLNWTVFLVCAFLVGLHMYTAPVHGRYAGSPIAPGIALGSVRVHTLCSQSLFSQDVEVVIELKSEMWTTHKHLKTACGRFNFFPWNVQHLVVHVCSPGSSRMRELLSTPPWWLQVAGQQVPSTYINTQCTWQHARHHTHCALQHSYIIWLTVWAAAVHYVDLPQLSGTSTVHSPTCTVQWAANQSGLHQTFQVVLFHLICNQRDNWFSSFVGGHPITVVDLCVLK